MQNFGKIKNAFNGILAEGVVKRDDSKKLLFKKYVKTIKENEALKTQFFVYTNIENKFEENEFKASEFIKANINLLEKFDKKTLAEANLELARPVLFDQGEPNYSLEKLHENITTLIFTEKSTKTLDTILEATANIINYIKTNKPKELKEAVDLPSSMLSTLLVDKYNDKYSSLDESEKQILKVLIDATDDEKKTVYSNTLRECIDLINEKLGGADLEAKDKLLRVKDKLLNDKQEVDEDFDKNISKLAELRESLKI